MTPHRWDMARFFPDSQCREAWAAKVRIPCRLTLDDLIEMQRPHRERMADDLDRIHRARWGDWRGR